MALHSISEDHWLDTFTLHGELDCDWTCNTPKDGFMQGNYDRHRDGEAEAYVNLSCWTQLATETNPFISPVGAIWLVTKDNQGLTQVDKLEVYIRLWKNARRTVVVFHYLKRTKNTSVKQYARSAAVRVLIPRKRAVYASRSCRVRVQLPRQCYNHRFPVGHYCKGTKRSGRCAQGSIPGRGFSKWECKWS